MMGAYALVLPTDKGVGAKIAHQYTKEVHIAMWYQRPTVQTAKQVVTILTQYTTSSAT